MRILEGLYFSQDGDGGGAASATIEPHFGLSDELKIAAQQFLEMTRGKAPKTRLTGGLEVLLPNVAHTLPESITTDYPHKNWQANALLESQGGLEGSIAYEMNGQKVGDITIAIGPARAKIEIVNNPNYQQRNKRGTDLYDNLPQMTDDFTRLVSQVKPTMQRWLPILGDRFIEENPKASAISEYGLTENTRDFLSWVREVFPDISDGVNKFMIEEKDPARRSLTAALLLQIGRGHRPVGQIRQFLDAPTSVPSRDMSFLHGTVLELLGEKNALLAGKQLEQGDLVGALGRILAGEAIKVDRLASGASLRDGAHKSEFGLPVDFAKFVTVEGNTITIDLSEMGRDKAGFVFNSVVQAVSLVEGLTGVSMFPKYNLTHGGVPAELFPSPDSPLSANALFLAGETGDLGLYQPAVGQRITKWRENGYMVATLTGPTGAGKTTLAQTMLRDFIGTMDWQKDDVLIFEARADVDEQGRPKLLNPDRLLSALRQYRELLQKRKGKNTMTALVVDNFHLLPFTRMDDELRRGILNEFDAIGGLLEEGGRIGGVIFLGENLPEGLDMSMLQQHRAEWVDLRIVGKEAIFKSAADIFAYKAMGMVQRVQMDIMAAAMQAGQAKDIGQRDVEAILDCFKDYFSQRLNDDKNMGKFASDKNRGPFFTLSHWAGLADGIIPQLQPQAYKYLNEGVSDWLRKGKAGAVELTKTGSQQLTRQLDTAFGKVYDLASITVESKLGIKSGKRPLLVPRSETAAVPEAPPPPTPAQREMQAREDGKPADLAGRIGAARQKVKGEIAALNAQQQTLDDLESRVAQLQQEREARIKGVQDRYGETARVFSGRGLVRLLLDKAGEQKYFEDPQAALSLIDQLASELSDGGNQWSAAVNNVTNNEFRGLLEQSGLTALRVIMTQVDNRQIWENPDTARALSTIVLSQVEQIRKLLGERGLSILSRTQGEIQAAFAEIDTSEIERKAQELSI